MGPAAALAARALGPVALTVAHGSGLLTQFCACWASSKNIIVEQFFLNGFKSLTTFRIF